MIDFPIDELLDEQASLAWLERHLHPDGLKCPQCGATERRVARHIGSLPAYRCKRCDRYHTILTHTVFEKSRQPPSKLVLLLRGIAKGESSARLSRELKIDRSRIHEIRQRVQSNLSKRLPTDVLEEKVFEADELYQNAGEKRRTPPRPSGSAEKTSQPAQRARYV